MEINIKFGKDKKNIDLSEYYKEGEYYSVRNTLKNYEFNILVLVSGRNVGKSYSVKEWFIEDAFLNNNRFILFYRYPAIKKTKKKREQYFDDIDISKITNGEYDGVECWAGTYYLTKLDEKTGKRKRGMQVGWLEFLSEEEHIKSGVYPYLKNWALEEFITRDGYLPDEVLLLESVLSTVFRNNLNKAKGFMLGNTINRVNPYITAWGLNKVFTQKVGTVEEYTTESGVKICVERCKKSLKQKGISKAAQQSFEGEWETGDQPCMSLEEVKTYDKVYEFVVNYCGFYFYCQVMQGNDALFVYIQRKTSKIQPNTRIIGDVPNTSLLYTRTFKPLRQGETIIFNLIKENKIFFSDPLTGADWDAVRNTIKF